MAISVSSELISLPLYKYIPTRYAREFFNTGKFRLNTLFEYAQNETYKVGTVDIYEGFYIYTPKFENCKSGCLERHFITARNQWVSCLSKKLSRELLEDFRPEDSIALTDMCCIEINSQNFFTEITEKLKGEVSFTCVSDVIYIDKTEMSQTLDRAEFAGLVKHSDYAYQHECRALWEPSKPHYTDTKFRRGTQTEASSPTVQNHIDGISSSILKYAPYEKHIESITKEQEWLNMRDVLIPNARKYCKLLMPTPFGSKLPFETVNEFDK